MSNGRSIAHAIKWGYLGTLARILMQLVIQITLLRMVGPNAYGVFAAALIPLMLGQIIAEGGIGASIAKETNLTDELLSRLSIQALSQGAAVGLVLAAGSSWYAHIVGNPAILVPLLLLSVVPIVQAPSIVALGTLRQRIDLKSIQQCNLIAYGVGFGGVGLLSVLLLRPEVGLAVAWLSQAALLSGLAIRKVKFKLSWPRPVFRSRTSFGLHVLVVNCLNWAIENVDKMLIGRFLGTYALGLYSGVNQFLRNPTNHLVNTLQSVALPIAAKSTHRPIWLTTFVLTTVEIIATLSASIFVTCAFNATALVQLIFGAKWDSAELVLAPLALVMPLHATMAFCGAILWGRGRADIEAYAQAATLIALLLVLWLLRHSTMEVIVWAIATVLSIRSLILVRAATRVIGLGSGRLFGALGRAALRALLFALLTLAITTVLQQASMAPSFALLLSGSISCLVAGLIIYCWPGILVSMLHIEINDMTAKKIPTRFRTAIAQNNLRVRPAEVEGEK